MLYIYIYIYNIYIIYICICSYFMSAAVPNYTVTVNRFYTEGFLLILLSNFRKI